MNWRVRQRLVLVLAMLGFLAIAIRLRGRSGETAELHSQSSEARFADLATALAPEMADRVEVSILPKLKGPYKLVPGGSSLGTNPSTKLSCRVKDERGVILEEINLHGTRGIVQWVVYLETRDGPQTMVALKRTLKATELPDTP